MRRFYASNVTRKELLDRAVAEIAHQVPPGDLPAATLARRIGLGYQRVYRWFAAGGPDAEGVMAILTTFGWLSIPEDGNVVSTMPLDPLATLEATVEDQGEQMTKALRALAGDIRKLSRQLEQRAPRASAGGSSR
jgi:hypothetical protein